MNMAISFAVGLVFGLGLIVSGMSNPARVIGFLDVAGTWNPSLAFVMAGAIALGVVGFRLADGRSATLFGQPMCLPKVGKIDRRLVIGAAIFGIGWGMAGICPGPAVVLAAIDFSHGGVFLLAMLCGMALYRR